MIGKRLWDNAPVPPSTVSASPKQVAKVLRAHKQGAMFEQIGDQTKFSSEIIWSAINTLEREGTVMGRNPFAYNPNAPDRDPDDSEKSE